jgi:hypothetical protein
MRLLGIDCGLPVRNNMECCQLTILGLYTIFVVVVVVIILLYSLFFILFYLLLFFHRVNIFLTPCIF